MAVASSGELSKMLDAFQDLLANCTKVQEFLEVDGDPDPVASSKALIYFVEEAEPIVRPFMVIDHDSFQWMANGYGTGSTAAGGRFLVVMEQDITSSDAWNDKVKTFYNAVADVSEEMIKKTNGGESALGAWPIVKNINIDEGEFGDGLEVLNDDESEGRGRYWRAELLCQFGFGVG